MKHLMILLASLAMFACSGGDADRSAEEAADAAIDATEGPSANVIEEAAEAMHTAIDKAEGVEDAIMESVEALDEAIEEATD